MRLILLTVCASLCACAATATSPTAVSRDIAYVDGGHERQVADLHKPARPNGTVVIAIHGGGWTRGDKDVMDDHVAHLLRHGYTVLAINYRLAPEFRYPAAIEDVRAAHRWLLAHADEYGVPVSRLVVFGYSAGGHLALLHGSTAREHGLRVDAMISGAGPSDLRRYPDSPYTVRFIGGPLSGNPDAYADASPIVHVSPDDPPALLYHGAWDALVEPAQSIDMVNALAAAGVPARYREIDYGTHMTTFIWERRSLGAVTAFLDATLSSPIP